LVVNEGARRQAARGLLVRCVAMLAWLAFTAGASLAVPLAAHADGGAPNLAYVVGGGAGHGDLVIIDIAQRRVTGRVHIGGDPHGVALSLDNRFAYVAQTASNDIAVIDAQAKQVAATIPTGRAPDALAIDFTVTGDMFVANRDSNTVSMLDLIDRRSVATIPVGTHPTGVSVAAPGSGTSDPNDAEIYVANTDSDSVSVISAHSKRVIATIPVPGGPISVLVPQSAQSSGVAYVGTRSGSIVAVGLADHRVLGKLLQMQSSASGQMDYNALTGEVYVPDAAGGVVDVLRPASAGGSGVAPTLPAEPARTIAVEGGPSAAAITFDGAYGFLSAAGAGQVTMYDVAAHRALATISVGGAPIGIITGSYPPVLNQQAANVAGILAYICIGAVLLGALGLYLGWSRYIRRRGARESEDPKAGGLDS
jgi:YVTN family beta-propeller protein